jgi:hypothetical protein
VWTWVRGVFSVAAAAQSALNRTGSESIKVASARSPAEVMYFRTSSSG